MPGSHEQWAAQRSSAAVEHEARLKARQDQEHCEAEELIARFISAAHQASLESEPLRTQGYRAGRSASTGLSGWYLRHDRKAAIDTSGVFYVLSAPLTFMDTIRGYEPHPSRPPRVLGAGGRDGDSVVLKDALERLLSGRRMRSND